MAPSLNSHLPFILLTLALLSADGVSGANVLMLPHPIVSSHQHLFMRLAERLLARGHSVTILRWHEEYSASVASAGTVPKAIATPAGARVISVKGRLSQPETKRWLLDKIDEPLWLEEDGFSVYLDFMLAGAWIALSPGIELGRHHGRLIDELRQSNFTLGIIDPIAMPASWMLLDQLEIPYVSVAPSIPTYYLDKAANTPTPIAYSPAMNTDLDDRMTFVQRIRNLFNHFIGTSSFYWSLVETVVKWTVGWRRVEHEPLMVMFLDEKLLAFSRPYTNSLVTMGLKERVVTTKTQQAPANGSMSKGTIIFSLSTISDKERMSDKMRQTFMDVFKKLTDYRIIWRTIVPQKQIAGIEHIEFTKWFNQKELLADPNTKLLITHGGISTVLEAARHGVPMLGMPLGFDHYGNVARVAARGMGAKISKLRLSQTTLLAMITKVLNDKTIHHRASQMRDMLESSAALWRSHDDQLLWHTEWALRHGRTLHRRRPLLTAVGESRSAFVYYHLDVAVLAALTLVAFL